MDEQRVALVLAALMARLGMREVVFTPAELERAGGARVWCGASDTTGSWRVKVEPVPVTIPGVPPVLRSDDVSKRG